MKTITLYRPTGPEELVLVKNSDYKKWPPRLPGQPFFYPVLDEDYAIAIARDWNVKESDSGFVTRFEVSAEYLSNYDVQTVGGRNHTEYWIPAGELENFNTKIIGAIEVIHRFETN